MYQVDAPVKTEAWSRETERFASTREELTAAVIGLAKRMRLDRAGDMAGSPALPA